VHNDVKVTFWVEWDVINEEWDVCLTNQNIEWNFIVLSVHRNWYLSAPETATKWLLNAIERYHDKINLIGHPYNIKELWEHLEIEPIVELANKYWIALEFNHWTFKWNKAIKEKLDYMLKNAKDIYVNSDAHSLSSIRPKRQECYDYLKELWIRK
jgi:histidinol phosphatase-like PHP family hydrolase